MVLKHPFHEIAISSDGKYLFAASLSSLQKLDLSTGDLVASFTINEENDKMSDSPSPAKKQKTGESQEKAGKEKKPMMSSTSGEGPKCVRTVLLSRNGEYVIAVTNENKNIYVLKATDLSVVSKRKFPKRSSAICTSFDDSQLLVGDKFGDVYNVPLTSSQAVVKPSDGTTEDQASIEPILGHVSMLTDIALVQNTNKDGKSREFVLSADRDEHIRVSRYPESYVIERWLFGHEQFVSSLFVPSWAPELLVSGGGDEFVAVFKWSEDKTATTNPLKCEFDVRQYIDQYLNKEMHSIPRRKKDTEDPSGPLEISVNKILGIEKYQQILVHFEATNAILVLQLSTDGQLKYLSTFSRPDSRIISATTTPEGKVVITLDAIDNVETPLVEIYESSENGELKKVESEEIKKINSTGSFELVNKDKPDERVLLYSVKHLRKRGEY